MKILSRTLLTAIGVLLFVPNAHAQVASAVVVSSCGTPPQTYSSGTIQPTTQDTNGKACSGATITSGTITPIGTFSTNASQPALTNGQTTNLQVDPSGNLRTAPQRPATGDILDGYQTFTSTTSATTLITVTAGRTWVGTLTANVACQEAAAGAVACQARVVFTTSGTNVTPAAGTYFACEAKNGANAASGLVGDGTSNFCSTPFTITAPVGNTVLIQVASTNAGTASVVDATTIGNMQ